MKKCTYFTVILLCIISAYSQIPQTISWQGILQDADAKNLSGTYSLTVKLFDVATGGTAIWNETHSNVVIADGLVNLMLGSVTPFNLNFDDEYWLEITVGNGTPLPRIKLSSVPYSLYAEKSGDAGWSLTGNSGTSSSTNFIGTTDSRDVVIRTNNIARLRITQKGQLEPLNTGNSVFIGLSAGDSNTSGSANVAIGSRALFSNTTSSDAVAIGDSALYYNGTGAVAEHEAQRNTAVGSKALLTNTTGFANSALGMYSLYSNTSGYSNTAIGGGAMEENTTGKCNTAIGLISLNSNTTGYYNTASGVGSLMKNTTGRQNTATGYLTMYMNTTGNTNSAYGDSALYSNTSGWSNVAIGASALYSNTDRSNIIAIGDSALYNNGLGATEAWQAIFNTAVGSKALCTNTTGYGNTANGYRALKSNTTGSYNTANGNDALFSNTIGYNNSANGVYALLSNSTGSYNTAFGVYSLYYNTIQNNNSALGYGAGDIKTSTNSTFVGYNAYPANNGYSNSSAFGFESRVSASNQVRIGNSSITSIGGYTTWSNISDGRFKKNINEDVKGLDFIMNLRPVTYNLDAFGLADFLKEDWGRDENGNFTSLQPDESTLLSRKMKSQIRYSGFIAQEVEESAQKIGYDFSGVDIPKNSDDLYGLRYAEFVVPLVKAVQEQQVIIEEQNKRIEELERKLEKLINNINEN